MLFAMADNGLGQRGAKPRDLRQLTLMRGIGATKVQSYGPQVLAVVGEWLAR